MCDANTMEYIEKSRYAALVNSARMCIGQGGRECDCDRCLFRGKIIDDGSFADYTECSSALMAAMADAIEELQAQSMYFNDAAKAIAEKVPKWIPVTERLPEVGKIVLTVWSVNNYPKYHVCQFRGVEHGVHVTASPWEEPIFVERYGHQITPTHWQPLPEPPKEGTE